MAEFKTKEELGKYLSSHNIPVDTWGKGSAKTLDHLLKEINGGETVLIERDGKVLRKVSVASITVTYQDKVLYEDRQEFNDRRVRSRPQLKGSVSEKFLPSEKPEAVAKRALQEELGITGDVKLVKGKEEEDVEESHSYPGLVMIMHTYRFSAELNDKQYSPNGYVEVQKDKKTYFAWKNK
jgi:hypothetical protein